MVVARKLFVITPRIEEILRTIHFYRYMTALDVAYRLYSPKSLTHVREILKVLCGGSDAVDNEYLFRFPLPQFTTGKTERVFTLGQKGRDYLRRHLGLPVSWYFRPQYLKHLSHRLINHNLTLTRFLVAAAYQRVFPLLKCRISYEMEKGKVVPDAWLMFDIDGVRHPILLEIDRGTEFKQRFQEHIKSRIEFLRAGEYQKAFGERGGLIVYATTGELAEYKESRCNSMCVWTQETLTEMKLAKWASILRFGAIDRRTLYDVAVLEARLWRRPDEKALLPLLAR